MGGRLLHQSVAEIVRGEIAGNHERVRRRVRFEAGFGESGEGQADAAGAEQVGNGGPDSFGSAGNQGDFAG